jgi:predicted nucleotidyltransferase
MELNKERKDRYLSKMKSIEDIKSDLSFAKDYEVIIFGSYAGKTADKRLDIDIANKSLCYAQV